MRTHMAGVAALVLSCSAGAVANGTHSPERQAVDAEAYRYAWSFKQMVLTYAREQAKRPLEAPAAVPLTVGLATVPSAASVAWDVREVDDDSALLCMRVTIGGPLQREALHRAARRAGSSLGDATCSAASGNWLQDDVISLRKMLYRSSVLVNAVSEGSQPLQGADILVVLRGQSGAVTLNNQSEVPLPLASFKVSDPFVAESSCSTELPALSSCFIDIALKPGSPASGALVGRLELNTGTDTLTVIPLKSPGNGDSVGQDVVLSSSP